VASTVHIKKWRKVKMAKDPGFGYRVVATITGAKGSCVAHDVGDSLDIS
jgi:hypothetical protein